jgi:hypothetical protein
MKIFWSWQSDTPGKTGRHFVRDALSGAVEDLRAPPDIEEPTTGFDREAIHLDSDRQGVPGSPDLAATIFAKIDAAVAVVADVTPVGLGPARKGEGGTELLGKALMNPNVAIELGYALGRHGGGVGNKLLMVCNEHYGKRSDLPFDLAHKAGPVFFSLAPNATRDEIAKEQKRLRRELAAALKPFLDTPKPSSAPTFTPTPTGANAGVWFKQGASLGESGDPRFNTELTNHIIDASSVFYLRLIPSHPLAHPRTRSELRQIAQNLPFFSATGGSFVRENAWEVANIEPHGNEGTSNSVVQLFHNGEIWAVNRRLTFQGQRQQWLPIGAAEMTLRRRLANFLDVMLNLLGVVLPITVEVGFIGVKGFTVLLNQAHTMGEIHNEPKPVRVQLNTDGSDQRKELLLALFERTFFELVQEHRPDNYNSFPDPDRPGTYLEKGW